MKFRKLFPRFDGDPRDTRLWLELNSYLDSVDADLRGISQGFAPGGGGRPLTLITGVTAHHDLTGLNVIFNNDGSIQDINDDHDGYALLLGRFDGQILNGSRFNSKQAWVAKSEFAFDNDKVSSSALSAVPIKRGASVGNLVVVAFSTDSLSASGSTNDHTTMSDTAGNTWVKRVEITEQFTAGSGTITSLWTSLITTAITTTDTLTMNLSGNAAAKTLQASVFEIPEGATIVIAGTAAAGQGSSDTGGGPSLIISGLGLDTYLWIRADGIEDPNASDWSAPAGYSKFEVDAQDRNDSTTSGGALRTNNRVRASFQILEATSSTTQQLFNTTAFPIITGVAIAIQITSAGGNLTLQSIDTLLAAQIQLDNQNILFRSDNLNLTTSALTLDVDFAFGEDAIYDIGTTQIASLNLYTERMSVGPAVGLNARETPTQFQPVTFSNSLQADARTVIGLRIVTENTSVNAIGVSTALSAKTTPWSEFAGTVILMERDTTNTNAKLMPAALLLEDVYEGTEVSTAIGAYFSLVAAGATSTLTALKLNAFGATVNRAIHIEKGDIWIDDVTSGIIFGPSFEAKIWDDGTDLNIDPSNVGTGQVNILGDLTIPSGDVLFLGAAQFSSDGTNTQMVSGGMLNNTISGYGFRVTGGTATISLYATTADGSWVGSDSNNSLFLYTNAQLTAALELTTGNDAVFDGDIDLAGSIHLVDNARVFFGSSDDIQMYFNGASDFFINPNGNRVRITGKTFLSSNLTDTSGTINFSQIQALGNGSSEGTATILGLFNQVLTGSTSGRGINFRTYVASRCQALFNRSNGITYASGQPLWLGGDFSALYTGTGVIGSTGAGSKWIGGTFVAQITGNKTVSIAQLYGGKFEARAISGLGGVTISDSLGGFFSSDVSGAASSARNYGILIENVAGGTLNWGFNLDGSDAQISSDNWLLLEGSSTTKGDTGLRYDSANTRLQFKINGTDNLRMGATTLGFYAVTPVSRQTISSARNNPEGALADLLTALDALGLITDSSTVS